MRHAALVLLCLLAASACGEKGRAPRVVHAWVRLAAVKGRPAAGYFVLDGGRRATRLVRVESALSQRVELHESMGGGGAMASMRPLEAVDLPPGARLVFAPGGRHLMLYDVDPAVTAGTAIPLRFGFADGSTAEAEAKTVAAGADAPY